MLKLVGFTAAAIFTAEALVMLFLESWGEGLSAPLRALLDATLLLVCVVPTLYFLVFRELKEQIRLRCLAEQEQLAWSQSLEMIVEERTERLQRANEDLLIEVQERAKAAMSLRSALNESKAGKEQLFAIVNAVRDALVVVDEEWQVLIVNQAAEIMFKTNSYDLACKSLKDFLLPWSQGPTDLDLFFSRGTEDRSTFLISPHFSSENRAPVQMRFGAELHWEGRPATVLMFYYREDLKADVNNVCLV